jgi:hypothetical protein
MDRFINKDVIISTLAEENGTLRKLVKVQDDQINKLYELADGLETQIEYQKKLQEAAAGLIKQFEQQIRGLRNSNEAKDRIIQELQTEIGNGKALATSTNAQNESIATSAEIE